MLTSFASADYELGRLYGSMGDHTQARQHYEMVMSGKGLEISHKKGKGKVSLQVRFSLRALLRGFADSS